MHLQEQEDMAPAIDLSALKNRGGKGEKGVAIVDGSILTLKENAAVAIAKDIIDNAKRRTGNELKDIPLGAFMAECEARAKPGLCTNEELLLKCPDSATIAFMETMCQGNVLTGLVLASVKSAS